MPSPPQVAASGMLRRMSAWSPTVEGFRTMFRRPALSLAEVAWRWSFGAAACVLLGLAFVAYLDTLPVGKADLWLLRTHHPLLVGQAFSHILHGSALRAVLASIVLFSGLEVLWILLASLGRGATLVPLLDHVRARAQQVRTGLNATVAPALLSETAAGEVVSNWRLQSLAGLHLLRAALALAAGVAILGALILAGFASSQTDPHPALVFFLANTMLLVLWLIWSSVSWFLSVASIFVVRQGTDTFGALSATVDLCRDRFGALMTVGTWFGLAHLVLFLVATSVVAFPFALFPAVPLRVVLIAVVLLTLGYFAIADTLYIGRLAGYVAILEAPPLPVATANLPLASPLAGTPASADEIQPGAAMVDQNETILCDTPGLFETPAPPSTSALSGIPAVENAVQERAARDNSTNQISDAPLSDGSKSPETSDPGLKT